MSLSRSGAWALDSIDPEAAEPSRAEAPLEDDTVTEMGADVDEEWAESLRLGTLSWSGNMFPREDPLTVHVRPPEAEPPCWW